MSKNDPTFLHFLHVPLLTPPQTKTVCSKQKGKDKKV